jgi:hypothetical protein
MSAPLPGLLVSAALRRRCGRKVGYAPSNEGFPLASTREVDLGRLSPAVIFDPLWGRQGRSGADEKQTGDGCQRVVHVRFLFGRGCVRTLCLRLPRGASALR